MIITYYENKGGKLAKKSYEIRKGQICTAAVWECSECGGIISGSGGPGPQGSLCEACGDKKIEEQN